MVILKTIPRILSPELLSVLARMGHGNEIGEFAMTSHYKLPNVPYLSIVQFLLMQTFQVLLCPRVGLSLFEQMVCFTLFIIIVFILITVPP